MVRTSPSSSLLSSSSSSSSSPSPSSSKSSGRHGNGDKRPSPGCISGIANLFYDTGPSLDLSNAKKLLIFPHHNHNHYNSSNKPRGMNDPIGGYGLEKHVKLKSPKKLPEQNQFGSKDNLMVSNKLLEMPIKELLAEEYSNKLRGTAASNYNSRNAHQNVLARLMGLDHNAPPLDCVDSARERRDYKPLYDGHLKLKRAIKHAPSHNTRLEHCKTGHSKKDKNTSSCSMHDLIALRTSHWEEYTMGLASRPHSYLHEQTEPFIEEQDLWSIRREDQIDDLRSHLAAAKRSGGNKKMLKEVSRPRQRHIPNRTELQERMYRRSNRRMFYSSVNGVELGVPSEQTHYVFTSDSEDDVISESRSYNQSCFERGLQKPMTPFWRPYGSELVGNHFYVADDSLKKQILVRKTMHATKKPMMKKKLKESKYRDRNEQLDYEMMEFMDDMSFLQANRDYFRKFLDDPQSVLARHLQGNMMDPARQSIPKYSCKCHEYHRDGLHEKYENWEKDNHSYSMTSWADFDVSRECLGRSRNIHHMESQQKLTSIVVLRPDVGNMSSKLPSMGSSKGLSNCTRENRTDVLQELRERLQPDHRERSGSSTMAGSYKSSDDPKEIARQIVRHARENALRSSISKKAMEKAMMRMTVPAWNNESWQKQSEFNQMSRNVGTKEEKRDCEALQMEEGTNHAVEDNCFAHYTKNLSNHENHGKGLVPKGTKTNNGESRTMDFQGPESHPNQCMKVSGSEEDFHDNGIDPKLLELASSLHENVFKASSPHENLEGKEVGTHTHGTDAAFLSSITSSNNVDDKESARTEDKEVQFSPIVGCSPESDLTSPKNSGRLLKDDTLSVISDISKDSHVQGQVQGQPSPVSVLDFHSIEFCEMGSTLRESQISLLKTFEHEAEEELSMLATSGEEHSHQFIEIHPSSDTLGLYLRVKPSKIFCEKDPTQIVLLDGIGCPKGKEHVFLYVKNVLIAYGIQTEDDATYWQAPISPLANSIFESMENKHHIGTEEEERMGLLLASVRQLLFDIVAELLAEVIGGPYEYLNLSMWSLKSVKSGKEMMQFIWGGVCELLMQSELRASQETLESLVTKDLYSHKDTWKGFNNVGVVVMEIERSIFNDVMHEMVSLFC